MLPAVLHFLAVVNSERAMHVRNLTCILVLVLLSTGLWGCHGDATSAPETPFSGPYLRLSLVMAPPSRADGSDKYHPDQAAFDFENTVADMTVFFYNASEGLNAVDETPIDGIYVSTGFMRKDNTINVDVPLSDDYAYTPGDRIAVAVNMGDISNFTTLGRLHGHKPLVAWVPSAASRLSACYNFSMASAFAGDGLIEKRVLSEADSDGSKRIRYTATASVERTAARIDLAYGSASQEKGDYLEYSSAGTDNIINGRVMVYAVLPVNSMREPSFAVKHISDGTDNLESWTYGGTLPSDADNRPSAYIIEPHTGDKKSASAVDIDTWYGPTSKNSLRNQPWAEEQNLGSLLRDEKIKYTTADNKPAIVLAYTNENTQPAEIYSTDVLTGLLVKARFVPACVYASADDVEGIKDYAVGRTFWRYRPGETSTSENNGVLYFATEGAAREYALSHPGDEAEITEYPRGECYYVVWLRHIVEERDPAIPFAMEYAVVRNHIYRVSFNFRGIGSASPEFDEKTFDSEAAVVVRPWRLFQHDEIII